MRFGPKFDRRSSGSRLARESHFACTQLEAPLNCTPALERCCFDGGGGTAAATAACRGMSTRAERRALQTHQRNQKALSSMVVERTCEIVLVRHGETAYNAEERLQASRAETTLGVWGCWHAELQ